MRVSVGVFRIGGMFDRDSGSGGGRLAAARTPGRVLADRIKAREHRRQVEEVGTVRDVMDWLALHDVDPSDPLATGPAGGVGRRAGSDGTPLVDEFAVLEYAALREISGPTARAFLLDVADLVHRFPKLFKAVMAFWLPVWQARKIAVACRQLSKEAALKVDAELAGKVAGLPSSRILSLVDAAVKRADPALAEANRVKAKQARYVALCRSEDGINTLIARADHGDLVMVYALVDRLADILALEGSAERADERRATAFGLLAQPAVVLAMLLRHAHDKTHVDDSPGATSRTGSESEAGSGKQESTERASNSDSSPEPSRASGPAQEGLFDDSGSESAAFDGDNRVAGDDTSDGPKDDLARADFDAEPGSPRDDRHGESGSPSPDLTAEPPPWTAADYVEPPDPMPPDAGPPSQWRHPDARPPDRGPFPPGWSADPGPGADVGSDESGASACPHCGHGACAGDESGIRFDVRGLAELLSEQGLKAARPRVAFNVYLTDQTLATGSGVVRVDQPGFGPMLASQLREFLGRHSCVVSVRPILDPDHVPSVDAYEIPQRVRDAVRLRHVASAFPWSSSTSPRMDLDHTNPFRWDGTPGQTGPRNLGPLLRGEHNARTHGLWTVQSPHPGVFLWRSPNGHYFLCTNQGTQSLGPVADGS